MIHTVGLALSLLVVVLASSACDTTARDSGCEVAKVTDGDTIRVRGCPEDRVRLLLIDAPELAQGGSPAECFGPEAKRYLEGRLPPGTRIRLQAGVLDRDQFGRALRYVFLGGELLDETLVREGYAVRFRAAEDTTFRDRIAQAEADARADGRGLWGACPGRN